MKLFKKLAAAVLAAALALTMVGCGGNSYAMQDELLKLTIDQGTSNGETVTHTKKADDLAAALLAAADKAAALEENEGMDAERLLLNEKVIEKARFLPHIFSGIAFSRCLSARFSGIKQRFLPRKFWCRKVHLLHPIILFLHILLYNRLVFSHLFFAASFPSIILFCPTLFRPFLS